MMTMMGFNFTERVRRCLAIAREESARLHHEYVGTEHMLLGLVREGEGVAADVLRGLGVDLEALARRVDEVVRAGPPSQTMHSDLPYTSRAKLVLELATQEAKSLGHRYVGSEHLLLGLVSEGKGAAAQVLGEAGVTVDAARSETVRLVGVEPPPKGQPTPPKGQPTNESDLRDLTTKTIERVEVILHYRDGRSFRSSFDGTRDALGFLRLADAGNRP
jgi:ATP-dependent Clp protease ATP-binding subunit ClpC